MRKLAVLLAVGGFFSLADDGRGQDKPQPGFDALGDSLPERALKRLGTARFRHGSRILCLAYAPNAPILAAGGGDDPVRLWDADTGRELRNIKEPWVHAVAFTPRGSVLATGGAFKVIRLWEVATGKEIATHKLDAHTSAVKALAMSPDGSFMASGAHDGTILLWEFLTGKVVTEFKGHTDEVTSLAFFQAKDPDVTLLVSGSSDRTVKFWDCETGKFLRSVDGGCAVGAVTFGLDGKTAYSGGDDHMVRSWDVASGQPRAVWQGHAGTVSSLQTLKDGTIISGAHDGTMRAWGPSTGKELRALRRDLGDSDAMAVSRDGKFIACAGLNQTIRVFGAADGKEVFPSQGHQAPVTSVALAPDGKSLVTASTMGKMRLWDALSGKELLSWACPHAGEISLAFAPDGNMVASGAGAEAIRFWDPASGKELFQLPKNAADPLLSLAFAPKGAGLMAVGRRNGGVELWDLAEKTMLLRLAYAGPVYTVAFSPDGTLLAASGGTKIAVYDVAARKEIKVFDSKEGPPGSLPAVASLAFAPESKTLAAGCYDGVIRLLDAVSGKEVRALEGHGHVPYAIAFSADGRVLASGSFDKTVRLWETFSGNPIAQMKGHQGPVTSLAFLKHGRGVFSGSVDTSLLLWDATGISKDGAMPALDLAPADQTTAWQELAAEEANRGQLALWKLAASGKTGVDFMEKQLYLVDPAKVDQLFKDLNSDEYKVRLKADIELEKYGRWMEGRLKEMHKNPPTLEVQRRIERLLTKLNVPGSLSLNQERLRVRRIMQALEQVATPDAVAVLTKLTRGAPEPALQQEAQASVDRLKARAK